MSGTEPITQVGTTATVRGVMRASIFAGSMPSDSSTSENTGTPLAITTAAAVAKNPMAGTMTSVPGPTPAATSAACSAPVPELTPRAYFTPKISRASFSKASPLVSGGCAVAKRESVGPAPRSSSVIAARILPSAAGENPNRSAIDMNSSTPIFGRLVPCILGNALGPPSIASAVCWPVVIVMIVSLFLCL